MCWVKEVDPMLNGHLLGVVSRLVQLESRSDKLNVPSQHHIHLCVVHSFPPVHAHDVTWCILLQSNDVWVHTAFTSRSSLLVNLCMHFQQCFLFQVFKYVENLWDYQDYQSGSNSLAISPSTHTFKQSPINTHLVNRIQYHHLSRAGSFSVPAFW